MLTEVDIKKFKDIYEAKHNTTISVSEATVLAQKLLNLMRAVYTENTDNRNNAQL